MVGIGGRSRACDNCKRRRIKCDLDTPACQRCVKARLQCGGVREIPIIQYKDSRLNASDPGSQMVSSGRNTASRLDVGRPLRLTAPNDEVFAMYTFSRLLRDTEQILVTPTTHRDLTAKSFVALSTTYFGMEHKSSTIFHQGLSAYSRALASLNQALQCPATAAENFDVLEAVLILNLFEFLISDREGGWINHSRGLERLLELRGPESMSSLPCLLVLERSRATIVFSAIILRQPTVMSRQEWKDKPWAEHPERLDATKYLVDILADLPALVCVRDLSDAETDVEAATRAHNLLLRRASAVLSRLGEWKATWGARCLSQRIEVPSTTSSSSSPLSTVFRYKAASEANAIVLHNGIMIFMMRYIGRLNMAAPPDIIISGQPNSSDTMHEAALEICRSIEYYLSSTQDGAASLTLLFPIRMAFDTLAPTDPVSAAWLKDKLQRMWSLGHFASARRVLEYGVRYD